MELANCTLALGGDAGNTIQKFDVTPAEIAVLRNIHGDDAVSEIEITRSEHRQGRLERDRLAQNYGVNEDGVHKSRAVEALFPGIAARLPETFEELYIDDSFYKAERLAPKKRAAPVVDEPTGSVDQTAEKPKKPVKTKKGNDKNTAVPDVEKTPDGSVKTIKGADGTDAKDANQEGPDDDEAETTDDDDEADGIDDINDGALFK